MTTNAPAQVHPLTHGTWALDGNHSSVGFTIRHLGVAKVRGRFGGIAAELTVGPSLEDSGVIATVDLASIDTGQPERDAHVRSADLLHVERRPAMTYRSTRIRGEGSDWLVDGDLTIGEVTRPLTLAVELGASRPTSTEPATPASRPPERSVARTSAWASVHWVPRSAMLSRSSSTCSSSSRRRRQATATAGLPRRAPAFERT